MARVLIPVMPRRYNHNPVGSSTATVIMKANNPFEAPVRQVSRRSGSLPGMGALDIVAPLQTASQDALKAGATSGGIDWSSLATTGLQTGINILGTAGQNVVNKLIPPASQPLSAPQSVLLPGQPGAPPVAYIQTPAPSKLPWIIGGVVVLGGVLLLTLRKK